MATQYAVWEEAGGKSKMRVDRPLDRAMAPPRRDNTKQSPQANIGTSVYQNPAKWIVLPLSGTCSKSKLCSVTGKTPLENLNVLVNDGNCGIQF